MTALPRNDENEIKQQKVVYLGCSKIVCRGMRQHVYIQSGYLYLKHAFKST